MMYTPDENKAVQRVSDSESTRGSKVEAEREAVVRWEDEGGRTPPSRKEDGDSRLMGGGDVETTAYQVGDTVIHWTYGSGKITAIENKGSPGFPAVYYIIEGRNQTLWVPVDEGENSSLHRPASSNDFSQFISILRSPRKRLPDNPQHRHKALDPHIRQRSVAGACFLIRDLNYHSSWRKMNNSDTRILRTAISHLLDEWELSLGTPRAKAQRELGWILKETPTRPGTTTPSGEHG